MCLVSVMYKTDLMTIQTTVALKSISYVSDLVPHAKVTWVAFKKKLTKTICAVQAIKKKEN